MKTACNMVQVRWWWSQVSFFRFVRQSSCICRNGWSGRWKEVWNILYNLWSMDFFLNNVQNFTSCFTGNTFLVYYNNSGQSCIGKQSLVAVYCESHTQRKYTLWAKYKVFKCQQRLYCCNHSASNSYRITWWQAELWYVTLDCIVCYNSSGYFHVPFMLCIFSWGV